MKTLQPIRRALESLDELIVPGCLVLEPVLRLIRWFGGIQTAVLRHDPQRLERISNDGTLRRSNNVVFLPEDQNREPDQEDTEA